MEIGKSWVVTVRGNVKGFSSGIFLSEREAIAYFKTIRRTLNSSEFIMTRESLVDKKDPGNAVRLTGSNIKVGLDEQGVKQAETALYFNNEPYIKLLEKAMKIIEQNGYSIVKRDSEYMVNIYYKVVYLGLAEVFITSSDIYFDEDSIIIEKESPEELALKITEIIS